MSDTLNEHLERVESALNRGPWIAEALNSLSVVRAHCHSAELDLALQREHLAGMERGRDSWKTAAENAEQRLTEVSEIPCCPPHEAMLKSGAAHPSCDCFVCALNERNELRQQIATKDELIASLEKARGMEWRMRKEQEQAYLEALAAYEKQVVGLEAQIAELKAGKELPSAHASRSTDPRPCKSGLKVCTCHSHQFTACRGQGGLGSGWVCEDAARALQCLQVTERTPKVEGNSSTESRSSLSEMEQQAGWKACALAEAEKVEAKQRLIEHLESITAEQGKQIEKLTTERDQARELASNLAEHCRKVCPALAKVNRQHADAAERIRSLEEALRDVLDALRNPVGASLAACLNRAWDVLLARAALSSTSSQSDDPDALTGTGDDQIDPAVIAVMRSVIERSGLCPEEFARRYNEIEVEELPSADSASSTDTRPR